jgi:conjugal transfer pilus assembly protein TraF
MTGRSLAAALSLIVLLSTAQADEERRGYWWKKEPAPAADATPVHPDLPPPPSEEALQKMHPADFAKLLDDYKQYALWKMEPQPVTWYYELQDVARRRSRAFMNVTETVMLAHPDLNMNTVYPTNNAGQAARNAERENGLTVRLAQERDRAALVLLTRPSCGFCEAQRAILKHFQQRHGWQIKEIDLEASPQAIARFGTDYTPTTVVIFRGSSDWMPVAVGVESVPRIEESVVRAVRLIRGETTPQQFSVQEFQDGSPLDPVRSQP